MDKEYGASPTDANLVGDSLKDPQRFAVIFDRHAAVVHRYVASRVKGADIDDVVSETFIAAFRSRGRYDQAYSDARPWLLGIATNVLRHHQRSEGRRLARLRGHVHINESSPDLADSVASAIDHESELARVDQALGRLDPHQRDVILLAASCDLTYEEIARSLDLPVGTVRSRLSRARKRLREFLDLYGQDNRDIAPITSTAEGTPG